MRSMRAALGGCASALAFGLAVFVPSGRALFAAQSADVEEGIRVEGDPAVDIGAGVQASEQPALELDTRTYRTPLHQLKPSEYPVFSDDRDLDGMQLAIGRQLARFAQKGLAGKIIMGRKVYPLIKAQQSLQAFDELITSFNSCAGREAKSRCYIALNQAIVDRFDVYAPNLTKKDPRYGQDNFAFFTGYHTHPIVGTLKPDAVNTHAIYGFPNNKKLNEKTRVEIDFKGALDGLGLDLAYTQYLFDIYLMHVAGSAKVTMTQPDGSVKQFYLQYAGTNRQRWEFISLYMARKGYITNGTIPAQRKFLREHPEKAEEIFANCPSYVYVQPTLNPPKGSDSVPVTDGRTIATDDGYYPFKGLLAYIQATRPAENGDYDLEQEDVSKIPFQTFSRFFLDQDTGGAIQGKARADIYFGSDVYAYYSAMFEEQTGKIHYLMLK